jgi:hypothetical protein
MTDKSGAPPTEGWEPPAPEPSTEFVQPWQRAEAQPPHTGPYVTGGAQPPLSGPAPHYPHPGPGYGHQTPAYGAPPAGYAFPPGPPPGYVQPFGPYPGTVNTTGWQQPNASLPGFPTPKLRRHRSRRGLIALAVAVLVVAALAVTAFWVPGFLRSKQLDVNAVQDGVRQVLTDGANGYGASNVTDVRCNNGSNPTISSGATFDCDVTINGAKRRVQVTFGDDAGTYWVGVPT